MEEIKVGDYIRTIDGKIDKIINDDYYMSLYIECEKGLVEISNIVKYSLNLIELIEVGDVVKVLDIDWVRIIDIDDEDYLEAFKEDIQSGDYKLLSLVTHEQFAQIEYIVKEN